MPVWIQCYRVILELFTQKGLSYIASAIGTPLYMDSVTVPKKSVDQVVTGTLVEDSVFDNITIDSVVADSIVAHEESGKGKTVVISPSPPPKKQVHFSSSSNWFEVLGSKLSNLPVLLDVIDAESTTASHLGCRIVIIMYLLPKSILQSIAQLCSRFFWKGSNSSAAGARVSWRTICLHKLEGGLGIRHLEEWNKACMLQLIRALLVSEGMFLLNSSSSWKRRRLLKLRDLAVESILWFPIGAYVSTTKL
ncbi:hypothetical protein Gotur_014143 [Gossypium turneri]